MATESNTEAIQAVNSVPFDATTSDSVGTMFLRIPVDAGRDLLDFEFSTRGGQEFLSFDSSVLRPAVTVPDLSGGSNPVTIGAEGLVEWRKVPSASKITISGQSDWRLFDRDASMIDSGGSATATKQVPAGAYLAVFGPAGSAATVVVEWAVAEAVTPQLRPPARLGGISRREHMVTSATNSWNPLLRRKPRTSPVRQVVARLSDLATVSLREHPRLIGWLAVPRSPS